MQRILVATDGSDDADRAIDTAAEIAKATGSALIILTAGGNVSGAELRHLAATNGDLGKTLEAQAGRILEQAEKRVRALGVTASVLRQEWGEPAETIIEMARREKADMVVVGRRGRGRLGGLLLGSVSQKVASLAPCPVLVVP